METIINIEADGMSEKVYAVLEQSTGGALKVVAGFMKMAEEVIESKMTAIPAQKDLIKDSFQHLWPSDVLFLCNSELLYRRHCEEIIDRVIEKGNLSEATKAETLGALIQRTLR